MKAIVANVLFGGIFGCLSCANPTQANPTTAQSAPTGSIASVNSAVPQELNLGEGENIFFSTNNLYSFNAALSVDYRQWLKGVATLEFNPAANSIAQTVFPEISCSLGFCPNDGDSRLLGETESLLASQKQYIHRSPSAEVVLGFQNAFWSSENQRKYWGVTTIEHWGDKNRQQLNLQQLNYTHSPPILATGSAALTFSGGGKRNLAAKAVLDRNVNSDREFEDFRGGVTYHQGVARELTMGFGLVYEDREDVLTGFTQLTYKSSILPITTTISLIAKEADTALHSHVRFQPSKNLSLNYHHDGKEQKFDANLGIYPGLTLTAQSNSKHNTFNTGIKVAIQNNYFSLTATAVLDREQNLQWQLNSQIGRLKLVHSSKKHKTSSELNSQLISADRLGWQCSAFVKYQTQQVRQKQQEFTVWGGRINSQAKVRPNQHQWSLDLGYGTSPHGKGWIAKGSIALKPDLFFKLNYQEISAVADDTRIKLELSSR